MKERIERRVIEIANHTIANKTDIRTTAELFGTSKSTVHKDLIHRLPELNQELYEKVRIILDFHLDVRATRGGQATKKKYQEKRMLSLWDKKLINYVTRKSIFNIRKGE